MAEVTTVPNVERDKLLAAIEQAKRTLPLVLEYHALNAQIKWTQYQEFIKAGFTEAQALELCK